MNKKYDSPLGSRDRFTAHNFNAFIKPTVLESPQTNSTPHSVSPSNQDSEFIPIGYSSPINNSGHRGFGSGGSGGNRGYRKNSYRNSSSPANSGINSSFSPYNLNRSNKFPFNRRNRGSFGNNSPNDDITLYYHHSMVEDPWAKLEKSYINENRLSKQVSQIKKSACEVLTFSDEDAVDSQEAESFLSSGEGSS